MDLLVKQTRRMRLAPVPDLNVDLGDLHSQPEVLEDGRAAIAVCRMIVAGREACGIDESNLDDPMASIVSAARSAIGLQEPGRRSGYGGDAPLVVLGPGGDYTREWPARGESGGAS